MISAEALWMIWSDGMMYHIWQYTWSKYIFNNGTGKKVYIPVRLPKITRILCLSLVLVTTRANCLWKWKEQEGFCWMLKRPVYIGTTGIIYHDLKFCNMVHYQTALFFKEQDIFFRFTLNYEVIWLKHWSNKRNFLIIVYYLFFEFKRCFANK
jgi:hypothetical protein